jgi:hypothetical protein
MFMIDLRCAARVPVQRGSTALQCDSLILVLPQRRVTLHQRPRGRKCSGSKRAAGGFSAFAPAIAAFNPSESTSVGKSRHGGSAAAMLQADTGLHGTTVQPAGEPNLNSQSQLIGEQR